MVPPQPLRKMLQLSVAQKEPRASGESKGRERSLRRTSAMQAIKQMVEEGRDRFVRTTATAIATAANRRAEHGDCLSINQCLLVIARNAHWLQLARTWRCGPSRDSIHLQPLLDTMSLGLFEKSTEGPQRWQVRGRSTSTRLVHAGSEALVCRCHTALSSRPDN